MRREKEIGVGEEGTNFFGDAVEDQRTGKTFLADEGADVCRFSQEGRVGV